VDNPTSVAPLKQMNNEKNPPKKELKEELKKKTNPEITPQKNCVKDEDCAVTNLTFRAGKTYCCHTCEQNPVSKTSLAEIAEYCRTLPRDLPCPEQNQCAQQDKGLLKCIANRCTYNDFGKISVPK